MTIIEATERIENAKRNNALERLESLPAFPNEE